MGPITNTARIVTTSVTGAAKHSLGAGRLGCPLTSAIRSNPVGVRKFTSNVTNNFNNGSKAPIVNECRNVTEGIANGDFIRTTVNAGMVGITAKLGGVTSTVKAGTSNITSSFIAGMSMGMIPFGASTKNNVEYFGEQVSSSVNKKPEINFQDPAQMAVAPEVQTKKTQPFAYKIYQGKDKQRQRSASPSRRMMSTRNSFVEQEAAKSASVMQKKPVLMPPYFTAITEKKEQKLPSAAGLAMSFHNYKGIEKTQRSRSPSPPSRRMMSTRNMYVQQEAAKNASVIQKKPVLMPPYFTAITEKKEQKLPSAAGLAMSFHNYKPLI